MWRNEQLFRLNMTSKCFSSFDHTPSIKTLLRILVLLPNEAMSAKWVSALSQAGMVKVWMLAPRRSTRIRRENLPSVGRKKIVARTRKGTRDGGMHLVTWFTNDRYPPYARPLVHRNEEGHNDDYRDITIITGMLGPRDQHCLSAATKPQLGRVRYVLIQAGEETSSPLLGVSTTPVGFSPHALVPLIWDESRAAEMAATARGARMRFCK